MLTTRMIADTTARAVPAVPPPAPRAGIALATAAAPSRGPCVGERLADAMIAKIKMSVSVDNQEAPTVTVITPGEDEILEVETADDGSVTVSVEGSQADPDDAEPAAAA